MDDFDRIEEQLAGFGRTPLAEPVPVENLRRRARRVKVGRALTGAVATVTVVAVVLGAVAATNRDHTARDKHLQVSAPNFVLGDVDAVVLASTLDPDGA